MKSNWCQCDATWLTVHQNLKFHNCLLSTCIYVFFCVKDEGQALTAERAGNSSIFVNAISIYCTHACFRRAREDSFKAVLHFISHCIHVRFIKEEFVAFSMDFNLFHDCKECLLHLHFVSCIFPYFFLFWALSHSFHSVVPFYCIHDSILFHLKMHFNGPSQSASLFLLSPAWNWIFFYL